MGRNHLSAGHRDTLARLFAKGLSARKISELVGYSPATISRERRRNSDGRGNYNAEQAQQKAERRRRRSSCRPKKQTEYIVAHIKEKLEQYWSPEQIVGRFRYENPDGQKNFVCFKTIYRWLREGSHHKKGTTFTGFAKYLRIKAPGKSLVAKTARTRRGLPDLPSIEERGNANDFGHWECDLIHGHCRSGYILTAVERNTGTVFAHHCPKKDISSVNAALAGLFSLFPRDYLQSVTYDRGKEFYGYRAMEELLGWTSWFCHPNSPQDKALNENTNGLLRQFFPRRMNFANLSHNEITRAVALINNRPRKKFKFKTTVEVLRERGLERVLTFV